jgi:hypothetical protein
MTENAMLYALYDMDYDSRATCHGFRSTASTVLNEHEFPSDVIERQLAHSERDQVRAAYNYAQYLAADNAYEWERNKYRAREYDIEQTLDKQGIKSRESIPHEADRRRRAERLIEMGKSYTPPAVERLQEKDGPDLERD